MTMREDVRAAIVNGELEAGFEALLRHLNIWGAINSAARSDGSRLCDCDVPIVLARSRDGSAA